MTVRSALLGPVELTGPLKAKRTTKEQYLHLLVDVSNSDAGRPINLSGWAAGQADETVHVTLPDGRRLAPAAFAANWSPHREKPVVRLPSGKASNVRLVITAPPPDVEFLRVELPGVAVGMPDETIKFHVGKRFLGRGVPPKPAVLEAAPTPTPALTFKPPPGYVSGWKRVGVVEARVAGVAAVDRLPVVDGNGLPYDSVQNALVIWVEARTDETNRTVTLRRWQGLDDDSVLVTVP